MLIILININKIIGLFINDDTIFQQRETPSETSTVVVEGFYGEEELITLVCHSVDDQDTYHDYTITKDILKATFAQEEEDIEKVLLDMLPVTVTLTIKNNNIETIDVV